MTESIIYILIAISALAAGFIIGSSVQKKERIKAERRTDKDHERDLERQKENYERTLEEVKNAHCEAIARQEEAHKAALAKQEQAHAMAIARQENANKEALARQSAALKAELTAQTEMLLKQREEALSKKAEDTFKNISGTLEKDLKEMRTAFDENRKSDAESTAALKEKFDNVVKNLEAQTRSIGDKADHLAEAMRGNKKFQGCWGETILLNLLNAEGLVEGRDFDKEETLRDELGFVILNENTEQKMRPDFILHYPDNQDVIVDAKVSMAAYGDYIEAATDEARRDASARNVAAIREQVRRLSKKDYSKYLRNGHRMLDYVIMFIPNYPALQLAYQEDSNIWKDAYSHKVLITTEETLMPFLRMITIAWRNVEQVRNQQRIVESAQRMVERVAEFSNTYASLGKKISEASDLFDKGEKKLKNSGQGILVSAHQVLSYGVTSSKQLPEADEEADT